MINARGKSSISTSICNLFNCFCFEESDVLDLVGVLPLGL